MDMLLADILMLGGEYTAIDKFPFASTPTTSSVVGNLSEGVYYGASTESDTDGYVLIGTTGNPILGLVQSFPFASPFTVNGNVGELNTTGLDGYNAAAGLAS
jgi:hypothetical protein